MGIPGTGGQLLVLLLFVLPGSVFQTVRTRLRGPIPSDQDATTKILRALAVSTLLNAVYVAVFGDAVLRPVRARSLEALEDAVDVRLAGLWAVLLLFIVPALLSCVVFWSSRWMWPRRVAALVPWTRPAYHPSSRTWDYAFADIPPVYVRVLTSEGTWAGGYMGMRSMAAAFPEPLDLFIELPYRMGEGGEFLEPLEHAHGMYLRCDDARAVEMFDSVSLANAAAAAAADENSTEQGSGTNEEVFR
ncbi:MAG: DUF6338 family protein [Marmoricola sp.]